MLADDNSCIALKKLDHVHIHNCLIEPTDLQSWSRSSSGCSDRITTFWRYGIYMYSRTVMLELQGLLHVFFEFRKNNIVRLSCRSWALGRCHCLCTWVDCWVIPKVLVANIDRISQTNSVNGEKLDKLSSPFRTRPPRSSSAYTQT